MTRFRCRRPPGPRARHTVALCTLCAWLAPAPAAGQGAPPLEIGRLTGPVAVDGVPDEAAWRDATPLPLTLYAPVFRGTPEQRTEIRVAYDDDGLYAAGWFYDTDPSGIRVNSLYRDRWNGDDAFALYVDAFNDNRNAKWFGTTPGGIRFDQLVSDDGATLNGSWDTFWAAETTVTGEGWFAEVRIPFSSLGFRADARGRVVMGLTATRLVSRTGERVTFPAIDPAFEFRRPSVAGKVALGQVRGRTPLYLTPYALTGRSRAGAIDDRSSEVGLDVRYPLSGGLTLDLTANTDFAQVEADDQQVNLDRFPLFYPERRRFFQEGSGLFDFVTGGGGRLFHSRRIGLTGDGRQVPVLGGARLVGRLGAWDVGAMGMGTDELGALPGERFGVLRLRRSLLNDHSAAGVMLTSRSGGGRESFALGTDASLRVVGDHHLTLRWAGTAGEADAPGAGFLDRSLLDARWERRTGRGLGYVAEITRAGEGFRPDLGFLPRRDFTRTNVFGNYFLFTDAHPVLRRVYPGFLAQSVFRNRDGALESGQYAVWVQWDTKAGGGGWIEPKLFRENVLAPFGIGGEAEIPAGDYTFADLQLVLTMPAGARLRASVDARAGTYFDGTRAQVIVAPTWNVSPHLELGGEYQLSLLRFADRGQAADIHVGRLRVGTALDASLSGNALVQYNSTTGHLDLNPRLRYAFAEGTDLWLVYNEGLDTERARDPLTPLDPRGPLSTSRSLILKYSHTFGL